MARTVQEVSVLLARRVLGPTGLTGPSVIDIDDNGRISSVTEMSGNPTLPDVSGGQLPGGGVFDTIVPGFIDLQVNGIDDLDVFSATGGDWDRLSDLLLVQGVTSWCPTLVTNGLDRYEAPLRRIAAARESANSSGNRARLIGAHLEGPFLGGAPGAHRRDLLSPIDTGWLGALPDIVRLVTIAPELAHAREAIAMLVASGIVVSLGHSTPTADDVAAAVAAGATMVTHLFNGMSGVHHRTPGLASMALVDDRLWAGLIADLIHVDELALRLAFRAKPGRIFLVTDAVGWRRGQVGEVRMSLEGAAPRLADGTLAGSAVTMDQALRNLVLVCGLSLDEVARAASTNPAQAMGLDDRGVIATGYRADLVALDEDLRVSAVWLDGHRVR